MAGPNDDLLNREFPGASVLGVRGNYNTNPDYINYMRQLSGSGLSNPNAGQFTRMYTGLSSAEQVPLTREMVRVYKADPQNGIRNFFRNLSADEVQAIRTAAQSDTSQAASLMRRAGASRADITDTPRPAAARPAAEQPASPPAAPERPARPAARTPRPAAEPRADRPAAPEQPAAPSAEEIAAQQQAAQAAETQQLRTEAGQAFDNMFKGSAGEPPMINDLLSNIGPGHAMYNYRDQLQRFANEAATDPAMREAYMDAAVTGTPPGSNMENNLGTFMNIVQGQMPEGSPEVTPEQMDMMMRDLGENPRAYVGMLGSDDLMGAIRGRGMMQGIGNMIGMDFGKLTNGLGGMMAQLGDWLQNLFSEDGPLGRLFGGDSPFGSLFGQNNTGATPENQVVAQTNAAPGTSLAREAGFTANDNSQTFDSNGRERSPDQPQVPGQEATLDLEQLAARVTPTAMPMG